MIDKGQAKLPQVTEALQSDCWSRYASVTEIEPIAFQKNIQKLIKKIGLLPTDIEQAALHIKSVLGELKFTYDPNTYELSEVLEKKRGNCLGLPLLAAAVLIEHGFEERQILTQVTNPRDAVNKAEISLVEKLSTGQVFRFHEAKPLIHRQQNPELRCKLYNHLGITKSPNCAIEMTSEMKYMPDGDARCFLSFDQATSVVLSERGRASIAKGDMDVAYRDLKKSIELDPENIGAIAGLFRYAMMTFDDAAYDFAKQLLMSTSRTSPMHLHLKSTQLETFNDRSELLQVYPADAYAHGWCAQKKAIEGDYGEARFELAIGTHLASQSWSLNMGSYLTCFSPVIHKVYGRDILKTALDRHERTQYSEPAYYFVRYYFLGEKHMLAEGRAARAFNAPFYELEHAMAMAEGEGNLKELWDLTDRYRSSKMFCNFLNNANIHGINLGRI